MNSRVKNGAPAALTPPSYGSIAVRLFDARQFGVAEPTTTAMSNCIPRSYKGPMTIREEISVVLIAHNEEQVIGKAIDGILAGYSDKILEIVVVDDASSDKTVAVVESRMASPKVRLVRSTPPCGVGRAIKTGFKSVNPAAKYVLSMDSDFVDSLDDVGRIVSRMEEGDCDGVIGSRFVEGGRLVRYPFTKRLMNRAFHLVVRLLFGIKQHDLSNNCKMFKREIVDTMPWKSDDFSLNAETGILPILSGYKVCEVPAAWIGRTGDMGGSKFKLFKVGWGYVKVIPYAWSVKRKLKASGNRHCCQYDQ